MQTSQHSFRNDKPLPIKIRVLSSKSERVSQVAMVELKVLNAYLLGRCYAKTFAKRFGDGGEACAKSDVLNKS